MKSPQSYYISIITSFKYKFMPSSFNVIVCEDLGSDCQSVMETNISKRKLRQWNETCRTHAKKQILPLIINYFDTLDTATTCTFTLKLGVHSNSYGYNKLEHNLIKGIHILSKSITDNIYEQHFCHHVTLLPDGLVYFWMCI